MSSHIQDHVWSNLYGIFPQYLKYWRQPWYSWTNFYLLFVRSLIISLCDFKNFASYSVRFGEVILVTFQLTYGRRAVGHVYVGYKYWSFEINTPNWHFTSWKSLELVDKQYVTNILYIYIGQRVWSSCLDIFICLYWYKKNVRCTLHPRKYAIFVLCCGLLHYQAILP